MNSRYIHNPSFIQWNTFDPSQERVTISNSYVPTKLAASITTPLPLTTTISKVSFGTSYAIFTISLSQNNTLVYVGAVTINYGPSSYTYSVVDQFNANIPYITVTPLNPSATVARSAFTIRLQYLTKNNQQKGLFQLNDTYLFTVDFRNLSSQYGVYTEFLRTSGILIGEQSSSSLVDNSVINPIVSLFSRTFNSLNSNSTNACQTSSDEVIVPIIDILGQTTVDAKYLSDFQFVIQDKYSYYNCKNIVEKEDCCKNDKGCGCKTLYYPEDKLKTTTFKEVSPPLQDVVKGKGCSLRKKLLNYYNKHPEIGPSFQDFYEQMILYGMLKYILARLIYGDFNIRYLYKNFNNQFFKDLENSRFCGFIQFFDNPDNGILDYDKYFICGNIN